MDAMDLELLRSAEDASAALAWLLGSDPAGEEGVVHVVSVWAPPGRLPRVMRIGPQTPRSPTDAFLLAAARARSDAIVTSAGILRDEPRVRHGIGGPAPGALRHWRRERVGLAEPARLLVLSRRGSVDPSHPALHARRKALLLTGRGPAEQRAAPLERRGVRVVAVPEPGARAALDLLAEEGARRVLVEAGPAVSLDLYRPPPRVDELWLARFCGASLPEPVQGGSFPADERLEALFPLRSSQRVVREKSGPWCFQRLRRQAPASSAA